MIPELAAGLRAGTLTAVELARRSLAAIAERDGALGERDGALGERDGALGAFVTVDADGALVAARRAGAELAAGVDRGPLHGVPVAVKDVIDVAGLPTTMGVTAPPLGERPVCDTLLAFTSPFNLAGLPALSVPVGTVHGLPVGAQLVCRPGHEDHLFTTAESAAHV